jgi:hypothetical protein
MQLRLEPLNRALEVGCVCPQRAARTNLASLHGALGTDAPYFVVHGEGRSLAGRSKTGDGTTAGETAVDSPYPQGRGPW